MAIPTWEKFRDDTHKPPVRQSTKGDSFYQKAKLAAKRCAENLDISRGRDINKVDSALKEYIKVKDSTPRTKIAALQALINACLEWLGKKKLKSNRHIVKEVEQVNHVFVNRKGTITTLANEALKELFSVLINNDMVGRDDLGRIKFFINKTNHSLHRQAWRIDHMGNARQRTNLPGQTQTFGPKALRNMGDDYTFERTSYLDYKRQNNLHKGNSRNRPDLSPEGIHFSGSGVHATHKAITNAGAIVDQKNQQRAAEGKAPINRTNGMMNNLNIRPADRDRFRPAFEELVQADVHHLTPDQWRLLDEIGRIGLHSGSVDYYKRDQRYKFMAIADGQGRLRDSENKLITAPEGNAYAMDQYGNFFQHDAFKGREGYLYFNHSSFNAGKEVICAGTLCIENGIIKLLTNETGHYKSTRQNLVNCLDVLYCEGVDLTTTEVRISEYFRRDDGQSMVNQHLFGALNFLNNPNGNPKSSRAIEVG